MNKITIHGRLTRDPETIPYANGTICVFTVAVNRDFGEGADFFNCIAFNRRGDVIQKYFKKGAEILVGGSMQCNVSEKEGKKNYYWKVVVSSFDFCGKKEQANPVAGFTETREGEAEPFEKSAQADFYDAKLVDIDF